MEPVSERQVVWVALRAVVAFASTGLFITGFTYCLELVGGVWATLVRCWLYCLVVKVTGN